MDYMQVSEATVRIMYQFCTARVMAQEHDQCWYMYVCHKMLQSTAIYPASIGCSSV